MGSNMMLTIAALFLFGLFVLAGNNIMSNNVKMGGQSEYSLTALSLAQSLVDEIKTKSFDQNTVNPLAIVTSAAMFTPVGSFGPDSLEVVPHPDTPDSTLHYTSGRRFNDVDDYKGYTRLVNTSRARGYVVRVDSIYYVDPEDTESFSPTRTYCKRIDVSVTSPGITNNSTGSEDDLPIRLSYAITY